MGRQYWIRARDQVYGPFDAAKVRKLVAAGKARGDHLISDDQQRWVPIATASALASGARSDRPPAAAATSTPGRAVRGSALGTEHAASSGSASAVDGRSAPVPSAVPPTPPAIAQAAFRPKLESPLAPPGPGLPNEVPVSAAVPPRAMSHGVIESPYASPAELPAGTPAGSQASSALQPNWLRGPRLDDWETAALDACRWTSEIRQGMAILGVLLVVNIPVTLMLAGENNAMAPLMMLQLGGFAVVGILAGVNFARPGFGLSLATAISIPLFACGCITLAMAIMLLVQLSSIRRAENLVGLDPTHLRHAKSLLADPNQTIGPGWLPCGRRRWLRLFDNRALVILAPNGRALWVERSAAATCLTRKSRKAVIRSLSEANGKKSNLRIQCSLEVAD